MIDTFTAQARSIAGPASGAAEVEPSDAADLSHVTRAIYVGGAGDLRVEMADGGAVTFRDLPGGVMLPARATRVYATGTTATGIVGLW